MTEQFDFDTLTDRRGTAALKWELMTEAEKRDGIVPLSVADMEFKSAPCVQRALLEAASHGLYGYTALDDAYVDALKGWRQGCSPDDDFSKDLEAGHVVEYPDASKANIWG